MADDTAPEAQEFARRFQDALEGLDRVRQLRGRFLDGMIEIEALVDELLCDFLHIEQSQVRRELVRCTVLSMGFNAKLKTLEAFLTDVGMSVAVVSKLVSLDKLRNA